MTRLAADAILDKLVTELRLINASRAKLLAELSIYTVRDLLESYPFRYVDLSNAVSCAQAQIGEMVSVTGTIQRIKHTVPKPKLDIIEIAVVDDGGVILGIWFRQPWMLNKLEEGMRVALSGKVTYDYGFKRIVSPYLEVLNSGDAATPRLIPVYHCTKGLTNAWMRRYLSTALEQSADMHDFLPASLRNKYALMNKKAALRTLHFPHSWEEQKKARRRLAYEEVFLLQVLMLRRRNSELNNQHAICHIKGSKFAALRGALPFELSEEQTAAVEDITNDMQKNIIMNRMLLGDVGTGKTIVSAFALAMCADSGKQAAVMAPTEVLARQYGNSLGGLLDECGISWAILTGSTKAAQRKEICEKLDSGELDVLFGTHALLEDDVIFKDLSLCIIDEQHRFGVNQRSILRKKGPGCDLLVMTATPIPRTLALTLYGDLETSFIHKPPAGRAQTTTVHISRDERFVAYDEIRKAIARGEQAYIICPLVGLTRQQREETKEDNDPFLDYSKGQDYSNLKAAQQEAEFLADKVFTSANVGLLTGKMASAKKQEVMEDFRSGKIDVLVATTVVEVGVDVPNATMMMIEDAERFGLSQLHQLRGRVGRGTKAGKVFIVADPAKDDTQLQERLQTFVNCSDGFELAQADLRIRHEGNVLGYKQHGQSILKLTDVISDAKLIQTAHEDAKKMLDKDMELNSPEFAALRNELERLEQRLDEDVDGAA